MSLDEKSIFDEVEFHRGTELERQAIAWLISSYPNESWNDLSTFQKFTWLAFAQRRNRYN